MRVARAGFAALVVTFASGAAHMLAGGQLPVPVALAVLLTTAAVAHPLTRRRLGSGQLFGLLLVAQAVTHSAAEATTGGGGMLVAHIAATVVSWLVLRHGEDVLRTLWDWLAIRFSRLAAVPARLFDVPSWTPTRRPVFAGFDPATPWRGPPWRLV